MKKKILVVKFIHETNSFCPVKADEKAFRNMSFLEGEEMFEKNRGVRNELGAFLDVFDKYDDFELVPSVSLDATPSGPVTADVYNYVLEKVKECIEKNKPFDGVLLHSHGAMVAEGHDDGEGDLFEFIRMLLGDEIPLVSTLDLHANVTEKMARLATVLIPYEKYPHIDAYETGCKAAEIMAETLLKKIRPVMEYRRIPFLLPLLPDSSPQMRPLYACAEKLNKNGNSVSIRFTHGFFPSDIRELGMAVLAVTDGDRELALQSADELCKTIMSNIPKLRADYMSVDDALSRVGVSSKGPLVIADASDNPGAGGLGDTTHILRAILEKGLSGAVVATITDAESVKKCIEAGVGARLELELGGWSAEEYSGGPLKVSAEVKKLTDGRYISRAQMSYGEEFNHGKTAVVEIGGNTVIITEIARQPYAVEILTKHDIKPEDCSLIVVKSAIHYRATYQSIAGEMIPLALSGYSVPVPTAYNYKKWNGD